MYTMASFFPTFQLMDALMPDLLVLAVRQQKCKYFKGLVNSILTTIFRGSQQYGVLTKYSGFRSAVAIPIPNSCGPGEIFLSSESCSFAIPVLWTIHHRTITLQNSPHYISCGVSVWRIHRYIIRKKGLYVVVRRK